MTFQTLPSDPPWLIKAAAEIGFHETGNNQGIEKYIALAGVGSLGDPWCAIFANAMLRSAGFTGTGSAAARSFASNAAFTKIDQPKRGAIAVFDRGGGMGHVGFWTESGILGGNENDQVEIEKISMPLIGYYWPAQSPAQPIPAPPPTPQGPSNFDACMPLLLASEGGNDDDPRDPGGRTSRGITQREWDVWRQLHPGLPSDVWQAPDSEVRAIYRTKYWNALQCDSLPAGVDYAVFDFGVNSGVARSAQFLQGIVGTDVDGEIGPLTIAATAKADPGVTINALCDQRLAFLQKLSTWGTFGRGWSARVARVRSDSLAMAAKGKPMPDQPAPAPTPIPPPPEPVPTSTPSPAPIDLKALIEAQIQQIISTIGPTVIQAILAAIAKQIGVQLPASALQLPAPSSAATSTPSNGGNTMDWTHTALGALVASVFAQQAGMLQSTAIGTTSWGTILTMVFGVLSAAGVLPKLPGTIITILTTLWPSLTALLGNEQKQ